MVVDRGGTGGGELRLTLAVVRGYAERIGPHVRPPGAFMAGEIGRLRRRTGAVLLAVGDLALTAALVGGPLLLGGRHAGARWLYAVAGGAMLVAWLARRVVLGGPPWRWTGGEWLVAAAVAVVALQVVPLPAAVLTAISPRLAERLPLALPADDASAAGTGEGSVLRGWSTLSVHPGETWQGLALLVGTAALGQAETGWGRPAADRKSVV